MSKIDKTPPIAYFIIDTDGKTLEQLRTEVIDYVNCRFNAELMEVQKMVCKSVYDEIEKCAMKEKSKMLSAFLYQLDNLDKIKEAEQILGDRQNLT